MKCDCRKLKFKVLEKSGKARNRPYKMLARCDACHRQYVCTVNMLEGGLMPSCRPEDRSIDGRARAAQKTPRLLRSAAAVLEQRRFDIISVYFSHSGGRQ